MGLGSGDDAGAASPSGVGDETAFTLLSSSLGAAGWLSDSTHAGGAAPTTSNAVPRSVAMIGLQRDTRGSDGSRLVSGSPGPQKW